MVETSSVVGPGPNDAQSQHYFFNVGGLRFFAKRFGQLGGFPVMALHGWMDNCASFDLLAPQLKGCDVVCIDCAGHGLTDHRTHLGAYNIWQDIAELFCIADQLGWNEFGLLGHSRGAICSLLAAGTLPERISHLALIEGVYPPIATAEETPVNLAIAINSLLHSQNRPKRYYDTFYQAVIARTKGFIPVSEQDAQLLAHHGIEECANGYSWRYDYKLTVGSEIRLNLAQVMAFQNNIQAKTLIVLADNGLLIDNPEVIKALNSFSAAKCITLEGDHHLHMSTQHKAVAKHVLTHFLPNI